MSRSSARRGAAWGWLLAVLAVTGLLGAAFFFGRGLGGESLSPAEQARQLEEQLAGLAEKLRLATQHERDLTALMTEARALADRYPGHAEVHVQLGQIQMQAGRWQDALQSVDRALALDPDQAEVARFAGTMAERMGDLPRAEQYYLAGVVLDARNVPARLALANVQLKAGRLAESEQNARRVLALNSAVHQAHLLLSDIAMERGDLAVAHEQVLRALTQLGDQSAREREVYTLKRARILRADGRLQDAVAVLRSLPVEQRYGPLISRELADAYQTLGHPELAALHYEQVFIMDPTHADAAAEAAHWYQAAGRPEDAGRLLEDVRRLNPRHAALERR